LPNLEYREGPLDLYQYHGKSNELGYRGPVYSKVPAAGVHPIVVIGDSNTEGIRIDDYADVWTAIMERRLNDAGVRAEVMNFGVSGYNALQKVETLREKALAYNPDIVVFQYTMNDGGDSYYFMLAPPTENAEFREDSQHAIVYGIPGTILQFG